MIMRIFKFVLQACLTHLRGSRRIADDFAEY